jgi:hypothetical protein
MSNNEALHEYVALCRSGQCHRSEPDPAFEAALGKFYRWFDRNVQDGRFKMGSRLLPESAVVSKSGIATDGPFGEAKEVVGGYWIIMARSLREAAEIAAQDPLMPHGAVLEIRPVETEPMPTGQELEGTRP